MGFQIDESEWPMLVTRWSGTVTDAEVAEFFSRMDGWLLRGLQFGLLLDSRGAQGLSADQRQLFIEYLKKNGASLERYFVQAVVFDNAIQRALYFGISWAFPMPFASKSFGQVEPAREWLMGVLRQRGALVSQDDHPGH